VSEKVANVEAIVARQRADLIAYLTRVKNLCAPTQDLVFMHSEAGVGSGLEAASSDRLAAMARNGQVDGLAELLANLPTAQQQAAVATLARWSGSFALAPERQNALTVLLAAAAAVEELDAARTAQVAGAVLAAPGELPPGALGDTVRLAARCRAGQRLQLVAGLKARNDVVGDAAARAALIANFPSFEDANDLYGVAAAMAIGNRDEAATLEILDLPEADQEKLLKLAEPTVIGWIEAAKNKAENPPEGEEPGDTSSVNNWLLPALTALEGSKAVLLCFVAWLLKAGNAASDQAVEERLDRLQPVTDPQLSALMLERMRVRPLAVRAAWLEAIDPAAIDHLAAAHLDAAARQLWVERTTGDYDADDFAEALEGVSTLARPLAPEQREFPNLDAEIASSTEAPMQDDASAEARLRLSAAAAEFVDHELADTTKTADRFILSTKGAMEVLSPGQLDQLAQTRAAAREFLADWLEDASAPALQALREAATQSPENQLDATKAEALLRATGRVAELADERVETPLTPEAIGILSRDYGDGADRAVEAWLSYFADDGELWSVLGPSWERSLSPDLRQAFAKDVKGLSKEKRQNLAEAAIDRSLSEHPPPPDNWEAVALRELGGGWIVRALGARRPEDGDLERWRKLLEIARQRTLGPRAKPLVAPNLLRPLIEIGTDDAVELALDNLGLTGRQSAEQMLKEVKLGAPQQAMAEEKLKDLGWRKSGLSGFFQALTGGGDGAAASDEGDEDD
jgi:hypothetical protein